MPFIFNQRTKISEDLANYYKEKSLDRVFMCVIFHRRSLKNAHHLLVNKLIPITFDAPIVLSLPTYELTGFILYEEVWSNVYKFLNPGSDYRNKENLWWYKDSKDQHRNLKMSKPAPFVLRFVDNKGTSCGTCKWAVNCYGCGIQPNDESIPFLLRNPFIAIDWNEDILN